MRALAATNTNSSLHITATNNTVSMPNYSPANGMSFKVQTEGHTLCLDASGNTATGNNTTNSAYGIYLYNILGTFQLAGGAVGSLNKPATEDLH